MAKLIHVALLFVLLCAPLSVVWAEDDTTTESTTTPETTTSTTTTTTEKTTTTSTTTEKTTTTTPTTSTSTTTPAPPGPTTPVPDPTSNHWVVKNGTKFCLLVDMAVQVNVTYKTADDNVLKNTLFDVPTGGKAVGECKSNAAGLTVTTEEGDQFTLYFMLNETTKQYRMTLGLALNVSEDRFPGAVAQKVLIKGEFKDAVPQGKSYHCNRQQVMNVTQNIDDDAAAINTTLTLSKAQWEAFHDRDAEGYDLAWDCDAIDTPDIVPIAVGCALAGLIVIVLLGYLVGRRRSQNRGGYLSM